MQALQEQKYKQSKQLCFFTCDTYINILNCFRFFQKQYIIIEHCGYILLKKYAILLKKIISERLSMNTSKKG